MKNKLKSFCSEFKIDNISYKLFDYVKKYNYELLTSPSSKKQSYLGKILWVRNNSVF